jgi:hypothetical protein
MHIYICTNIINELAVCTHFPARTLEPSEARALWGLFFSGPFLAMDPKWLSCSCACGGHAAKSAQTSHGHVQGAAAGLERKHRPGRNLPGTAFRIGVTLPEKRPCVHAGIKICRRARALKKNHHQCKAGGSSRFVLPRLSPLIFWRALFLNGGWGPTEARIVLTFCSRRLCGFHWGHPALESS